MQNEATGQGRAMQQTAMRDGPQATITDEQSACRESERNEADGRGRRFGNNQRKERPRTEIPGQPPGRAREEGARWSFFLRRLQDSARLAALKTQRLADRAQESKRPYIAPEPTRGSNTGSGTVKQGRRRRLSYGIYLASARCRPGVCAIPLACRFRARKSHYTPDRLPLRSLYY